MLKLTTDQIRQIWLDYFQSKGHFLIPSKSLIPENDRSLLWINSGVATLKKYFSGIENPPAPRLTNSQRAIRTNDITNVGVTARHHTFFEMLGNFSIGDYFKKEAIFFAYDLLINHYHIDKSVLYFTVFEEDQDAYAAWIALGIEPSHIIKGNRNRNFWDIGQGPCGPCTEIYYDRGEKYDPKKIGIKLFIDDIENDRYVEIWNVVFSQFNNDGKNNYSELTRKNIDTGAGLERLASISQDTPTNFDIDIFIPIIKSVEKLCPNNHYDINAYFNASKEQVQINRNYKIIADHIKASVFAIADGAIPSNKERGSVLRKLIRRAMVCAKRLGVESDFITPSTIAVIQAMKGFYPYLLQQQQNIIDVLIQESLVFQQTLDRGYKLFNDAIEHHELNGATIFQLVETYGFPFEIIVDLTEAHNIKIDYDDYERRLKRHQDISRANVENKGMLAQNGNLLAFQKPSVFDYDHLTHSHAKVIACFNEKFEPVNEINKRGWIVFDTTVFYATSGGQQHDYGYIEIDNQRLEVIDVLKGPNLQHLHLVNPKNSVKIGDDAVLVVDQQIRDAASRNHSVEHLLQHALQSVIDKNIKQEGAFKSADKLSFDFILPRKLTIEQIKSVQKQVNEYIHQALPVSTALQTLEEAKQSGAIAYFEDVYAKIKNKLRVVNMGGLSIEICGGTHVKNTKDIEAFMITKYFNKGGGTWRIEGVTSQNTIIRFLNQEASEIQSHVSDMIQELKSINVPTAQFEQTFKQDSTKLSEEKLDSLKLQYENLKLIYTDHVINHQKQSVNDEITKIQNMAKTSSKSGLVNFLILHDVNVKAINQALTQLSNEHQDIAFVVLNITSQKIQYLAVASKTIVDNKKFSAKSLISELNKITNGSGGGRDEFAQGGTIHLNTLEKITDFLMKL